MSQKTANTVDIPLWLTGAGQLLAALGVVLQWQAGGPLSAIAYPLGAVAILWLDRRSPFAPLAAIALSAWVLIGGFLSGSTMSGLDSGDGLRVAGGLLVLAGLAVSTLAAPAAIGVALRDRTAPLVPPWKSTGTRLAALVLMILAMATVGLGLATALGIAGPGPILFFTLPVLVALVPGRSMVLLGVLMSGVFIDGVLSNPRLDLAASAVQLSGLAVSILAGAALLLLPRRE
ncbi:hypothetical protein ACPZ19_14995 [Amycolatopsis lurida]